MKFIRLNIESKESNEEEKEKLKWGKNVILEIQEKKNPIVFEVGDVGIV